MESKSDGALNVAGALRVVVSSVYPASISNRLAPLDCELGELGWVIFTPFWTTMRGISVTISGARSKRLLSLDELRRGGR